MSSEHSSHLENSESLKVPKKQGEKAIQLLAKLELLNQRLSPRTVGNQLHVPLSRAPRALERRQLEQVLGKHDVTREKFASRPEGVGSLEKVLAQQLPSSVIPLVSKSFDVIGDIAIMELAPSAEAFEEKIAGALMKVHKNVKAVYSKAGSITDKERLRPLHHVLGADRTETTHKELGCRFKVDIAKAFFSPRLSSEHARVAEQVLPRERVVDMFAGVGPFSILIAKRAKAERIHAIDANPEATKLIKENATLNKVHDRITVWSGDARSVVENNLLGVATRVIMNHPSKASEFLQTACEALQRDGGIVHYYTFAKGIDCESKARDELASSIDGSEWQVDKVISTRKVRGVGPVKWQVVVDAKIVPA